MKVELIKYPTEEDWLLCKQATLVTVGKETMKAPTYNFKHNLLKARHSPIRTLNFMFKLEVPYWVSVHLVRHVHATPFVKTQRTDRTGIDRTKLPQDEPVTMMWYMNAEELMVIANKRLCNQASKETSEVVREMCNLVLNVCPEFENLLVPACLYNGGVCHEMHPCGKDLLK